jgi:hypothetical protein
MRTYFIRLGHRQWITTSSLEAAKFVHSFGLAGFGLYSKKVEGQSPIDNILSV